MGDALPSHLKGTDPILPCLRASTGEHKARPIIPSVAGFGCRPKKSNEGDLCLSFVSPSDGRRGGIIPNRTNQSTGAAGKPPSVIALEHEVRNPDVCYRTDAAHQAKREQSRQKSSPAQAHVTVG